LRRDYSDYAELSLAIILAAGLGIATILINLSQRSAGIQSYLFGSISLVGTRDIYIIFSLAILIIAIIIKFYYGFFFLAFNEDEARLAGVPARSLNIIFMIVTSLTVALSIQIVGTLLIASLITIPVATGMLLGKSFKMTIWYSILFSLISVNTGIILSFYFDLASGGTIILFSVILLLFVIIFKKIFNINI